MKPSADTPTIIITGGFGTLGRAAAQQAVHKGYNIALIDRAPAPTLDSLELPASTLLLGDVDLTDKDSANAAIAKVNESFGRIDSLFNIAGGFRWETFNDNELDSWDFLFSLNVKTAITASKAVLPFMLEQKSGSIVCVSAGAAVKSDLGLGAYAASKAGVSRFVESLSQEIKDQGIRINAVMPSIIDTAPNRADMPDADFSAWVSPAALAKVMLFLASSDAEAVTGTNIPVVNRC